MFLKNLDMAIENCVKEILDSKDPSIKKVLKKMKKEFSEEKQAYFLNYMVKTTFSNILFTMPDEKAIYEEFVEHFDEVLEQMIEGKKMFVIKATLRGHETEVYRTMEIPYGFMLDLLASSVLAAFQADGGHLFSIKHKTTNYVCDTYEGDFDFQYASQTALPELNLRKGSKLALYYDFGDNYIIDMKVEKIIQTNDLPLIEDLKIVDGKGYGIWEDSHYELDLFYDDYKAFKEHIADIGIDDDAFPIDEEFDLDEANENLRENTAFINMSYMEAGEYGS